MSEFDNVTGSDSSSTPAPATQGAPAAAPTQTAPAPAQATQGNTQAPATQGAPGEGWVPSYRVRETREAAFREAQQQFAQRESQYQARLNQIQSQLHALVGATPSQSNPEVDAVRQQFASLFPKLAKLEERGEDVFGLLERSSDLEAQTNHYWQSYGKQSMDRLFAATEKSLGQPLTAEGKRALHSSFVGFVQSSPEMTSRYAQDPTIVDDFVQAFTSNFIDPVRRSSAATVQGRAAANLPQDTPGGVPRATPAPRIEGGLDERVAAGFARYQQLTGKQ